MNKILILYPNLFNCYEKFNRKVGRILSNLSDPAILYPSDPAKLIERFHEVNACRFSPIEAHEWTPSDITHAIVFDDGYEFGDEIKTLKAAEKPLREIKIAITRVVNIKTDTIYQNQKSNSKYEYIGRGSYWGNPYSMYGDGDDRDEVIRKYKYDFDFDKFPNKKKSEVYKLAGKTLGCFCKPKACHGDILADFLNSWDDGN